MGTGHRDHRQRRREPAVGARVPVGRYTVTFRGPNDAERTVTVDVGAEGIAVAPVARFEEVTGKTYFEKYFAPAPVTPAAPPSETAPGTPPAGGQQ